jgi:hypothetical protein
MCIQYLCPPQLTILKNQSFSAASTMRRELEMIERQRAKMEEEVVYHIKHRKTVPGK